MAPEPSSRRDLFEKPHPGANNRPSFTHPRHDMQFSQIQRPQTLDDYRAQESPQARSERIHTLWLQFWTLQQHSITPAALPPTQSQLPLFGRTPITLERAEELRKIYFHELFAKCQLHAGSSNSHGVDQKTFRAYVDQKEEELWNIFHSELDLDGNGHLDADELQHALSKAGIDHSPLAVTSFIESLSSGPQPHTISFPEFRDYFLLLPRKPTPEEIFRYYEVRRYIGEDGRGPAQVNMEGDVILISDTHTKPLLSSKLTASHQISPHQVSPPESKAISNEQGPEESTSSQQAWYGGHTAVKFLLAGGIAGAVSRTATAPFDRLKVFLITRPPDLHPIPQEASHPLYQTRAISIAVRQLFAEGGLAAFWVGNGLNVMKIFPESAIKFFSYESSKLFFAKYWDKVEDPREIGGTSRFISGGIGGITSQLSIYPVETLKTQMMSSTGETKRTLLEASRRLWALGGVRAYYRGLVIGLVGVFPYSAIDMSTFEALKLAYVRSTGEKEPGVLATLTFGSTSGAVGATAVYPLNLVRTRMQASGSSGHPQIYTGVLDVASKTLKHEGIQGFYRGLVPTLAKVVPAVSISYVVYEDCKKRLGVT